MTDQDIAVVAAMFGGAAAGMLMAFAALGAMTPRNRDSFLRGACDAMSPGAWLRYLHTR